MIRQIITYKVAIRVLVSSEPLFQYHREQLFLADHAAQAVRQAATWASVQASESNGEVVELSVSQFLICRSQAGELNSGARPALFMWHHTGAAAGISTDDRSGQSLAAKVESWTAKQQPGNPPTGGAVDSARSVLAMLECSASREMLMAVANIIDRETMVPELLDAGDEVMTALSALDPAPAPRTWRLGDLITLLRCRRQIGGLPPALIEKQPAAAIIAD